MLQTASRGRSSALQKAHKVPTFLSFGCRGKAPYSLAPGRFPIAFWIPAEIAWFTQSLQINFPSVRVVIARFLTTREQPEHESCSSLSALISAITIGRCFTSCRPGRIEERKPEQHNQQHSGRPEQAGQLAFHVGNIRLDETT